MSIQPYRVAGRAFWPRFVLAIISVLLATAGLCGSSSAAEPTGKSTAGSEQPALDYPFPKHMQSPSLDGGVAWINTGGPLDLKQLRGKFVVLDFWTYCCINCMHILPVLKKLEHTYPNEVVVIGVHSAKFETEQDSDSITEAVLRYEIEHPVINDARHVLWEKFFVNSWPSLRIIDPEGNLVAASSGEIDFETVDKLLNGALPYYRQKGLLNEAPLKFDLAGQNAAQTPLRFPGKILADENSDRLFIADSNHNRIVVARLDGTLVSTIGSGAIGRVDGDYAAARFDHPQGMALDGDTLYVADTENHMLRKVDLKQQRVVTVAGIGTQGSTWPGGPNHWFAKPADAALNSPWALWIHQKSLYVAMAGFHQIWRMPLDESEIGPYAGNGREDIVDGSLLPKRQFETGSYCSFAQPSGLTSDGTSLYVADSEGSSIRVVPFNRIHKVRTLLGTASQAEARLFTFGDMDGKGPQVRFQHPLDVAWHDKRLYVCDTYNSKIKVIDPAQQTAKTLAGTGKPGVSDEPAMFNEPAGLSAAAGKLYVADTNNNRIRTIDLKHGNRVATLAIVGLAPPAVERAAAKPSFRGAAEVKLPAATVKPTDGKIRLNVKLALPPGFKINPLAPLRYYIESADGKPAGANAPIASEVFGKLGDVKNKSATFTIELPVARPTGSETIRVSLAYYFCREGAEGLCKAASVVWTLPLTVSTDAPATSIPLEYTVE